MKLNALFNKAVVRTVLALTVLAFAAPTFAASKKGARSFSEKMTAIKTVADAEAVKPGDRIAMACAKCKTILVSVVKKPVRGAAYFSGDGKKPTNLVAKHGCPGCKSEITVKGVGKGKERVIKHTCTACGDESAFCCVTRKGAGPTKGMEKKKK